MSQLHHADPRLPNRRPQHEPWRMTPQTRIELPDGQVGSFKAMCRHCAGVITWVGQQHHRPTLCKHCGSLHP